LSARRVAQSLAAPIIIGTIEINDRPQEIHGHIDFRSLSRRIAENKPLNGH